MSGSGNSSGLLSCSLIICVNVDLVSKFLEALFQCPPSTRRDVPCRYASLQLSITATLVLIDSASLDEEMKATFSSVCVRQLFVHDHRIREIEARALRMSALHAEGTCALNQMCVVEAPEGITIHILGSMVEGRIASEFIMKSLLDRVEQPDEHSGIHPAQKLVNAPPRLRTVDVSLQSDYLPLGVINCPSNNRIATPFETELFKGHAMIMVRTHPLDDHFREFFDDGKKRTFEVQVQGNFKRMPVGEIYVGADVTNKMELGIITRSFSRAILKFVNTMVNNLHYSFGDFPDAVGFEKPHIVAPLFSTMDKIVETPEGGVPPPMGKPFPEDPEYRSIRLKNRRTNDMINLSSTYSFSVNTSNMDLVSWNLVGIPMLKPIDMRTFFGESPIRLVGYEMPAEEAAKYPGKHPASAMNYVFNMKLKRLESAIDDSESNSEFGSGAEEDVTEIPNPAMLLGAIEEEEQDEDPQEGKSSDDEKNDDDHSIDAGGKPKRTYRRLWRRSAGDSESSNFKGRGSKKLGQWLGSKKKEVGEFFHRDRDLHFVSAAGHGDSNTDIMGDGDHQPAHAEEAMMESDDDLRYCPACVDAIDHRKDGKRRTLFAFPWSPPPNEWSDSAASAQQLQQSPKLGAQLLGASPLSRSHANVSVLAGCGVVEQMTPPFTIKLRSHSEVVKSFPVPKDSKISNQKLKRLTTVERERRQMAETYAAMLNKGSSYSSIMNAFFGSPSDTDRLFLGMSLSKGSGNCLTPKKTYGEEMWEGSVAFATDKRHWVEGVAFISNSELMICKSADARKVVNIIAVPSIISVRPMWHNEVPMDMFKFFQVETFSRVLYFMVRNDRQLEAWMTAFAAVGIHSEPNYSERSLSKLVEDLYFGASTAWRLEKKRLFNYRNIIFRKTGLSAEFRDVSVTHLAEGLLEKVFSLLQDEGFADVRQWIQFMDWASALQAYDLYALEGVEKVAVLLNVYHAMVLHGMIILGPPASWSSWPSFFNFFSYIISSEHICLSEFEFNILRSVLV